MAKSKLAKGDALVCVPCGAEYVVSNAGSAYTVAWCCGVPMKARPAAARKKAAAKKAAPARRAAAKKPAAKKGKR